MISLFREEIKRVLKNPLFLLISILIIAFSMSQMGRKIDPRDMDKPKFHQESYGTTYTKDKNIIKPNAISGLLQEYLSNSYTTYPYGFYRNVELNNKKNEEMTKLLSALTGESVENLKKIKMSDKLVDDEMLSINDADEYMKKMNERLSSYIKKDIGDEEFLKLMEKTDQLLGGGSSYSKSMISMEYGGRPKTYEEAVREHNLMIEKDKISGAYARLFCDYTGIALGFLPIFLSVAFWYMDKGSKSQDILYSKPVSTISLIISRYLAMLISFTIVLVLFASYYNFQVISEFGLNQVDPFYFYGYTLVWLLPIIMLVLSVGTFMTIVTDSPIGIGVQLIWWFLDMFTGISDIKGGYEHSMVLRHNIVGNTMIYMENRGQLFLNRSLYILLAIGLLILSIWIYNEKRKGKVRINGIRKNKENSI